MKLFGAILEQLIQSRAGITYKAPLALIDILSRLDKYCLNMFYYV